MNNAKKIRRKRDLPTIPTFSYTLFISKINVSYKVWLQEVFLKFAKIIKMKTLEELRFDLNVKLMKFRRFRFENGNINNLAAPETEKKGFFKKIFS